MKKLLILAFLLFIGDIAFAQKVTDPKERKEFKEEFIRSCMEGVKGEDEATQKAFNSYCICGADNILDSLTRDVILKLDDYTDEEFDKFVGPSIQGCLLQLEKDLNPKKEKK